MSPLSRVTGFPGQVSTVPNPGVLTPSNLRHCTPQNLSLRDPDRTGFPAHPRSSGTARSDCFQERLCKQSRNRLILQRRRRAFGAFRKDLFLECAW
jgi:hypothetical protein